MHQPDHISPSVESTTPSQRGESHNNSTGILCQLCAQCFQLPGRNFRQQRLKRCLVLRICRHTESTHTPPMESILKADNLRFGTLGALCIPRLIVFERLTIFSDFAGNLECTFICFRTRIQEDLKPTESIGRLVTRHKTKSTFTLGSRYKKRWELNDHSL